MEPRDVRAAGAVVTRKGGEVLLVHRPKYDDWSFPKGKLDRGEHVVTAAVREVAEETGLDVRLGPALTRQRYRMSNGRWKAVDYWTARVAGSDDVSRYRPNDEIDAVEWVDWKDAQERLTYAYDRDTLAEARPLRRRTRALAVLRHAEARSRNGWKKDDRRRPLVRLGETQSQRLVPLLAAFDVTVAHTSSSTRCVQTVMPYVDVTGWPVKLYDELSEEGRHGRGRRRPRRRVPRRRPRRRERGAVHPPAGAADRARRARRCPTSSSSPGRCSWCTTARAASWRPSTSSPERAFYSCRTADRQGRPGEFM